MTDVELAYCAGLIDGEGCIRIKKDKAYNCQERVTPGYHARIQVRMVERAAIDFLRKVLGGTCYLESKAYSTKTRPLYCWSLSDLKAETALRHILPNLLVKRRQAETVLALRELQRGGLKHRTKVVGHRSFPNNHGAVRIVPNLAFSDEYVARCEALFQESKRLNRVGLSAFQD